MQLQAQLSSRPTHITRTTPPSPAPTSSFLSSQSDCWHQLLVDARPTAESGGVDQGGRKEHGTPKRRGQAHAHPSDSMEAIVAAVGQQTQELTRCVQMRSWGPAVFEDDHIMGGCVGREKGGACPVPWRLAGWLGCGEQWMGGRGKGAHEDRTSVVSL